MDRPRAFRAFGGAGVALFVPLAALDRRMTATGGLGIIPFELAGTPERARKTMTVWGPAGRAAARQSLLLDFPFLVAYTGFNVAVTAAASDALRHNGATRLADAGPAVTAALVAAGACDAVENTALLGVLADRDDRLPALARTAALGKFALLGIGALYGAAALASRLRDP